MHITELGADYFQFDEARHELRGERTGKRYQLTDKVKVQVSRVDLDARKIDLSIVQPVGANVPLWSGATEKPKKQIPGTPVNKSAKAVKNSSKLATAKKSFGAERQDKYKGTSADARVGGTKQKSAAGAKKTVSATGKATGKPARKRR